VYPNLLPKQIYQHLFNPNLTSFYKTIYRLDRHHYTCSFNAFNSFRKFSLSSKRIMESWDDL